MKDCQNRMLIYHRRSRKAHHRLDLFPSSWTVTMNRAFFTGRFPETKRAAVDPLDCIFLKFPAFITQCFPAMHGLTIDANHRA